MGKSTIQRLNLISKKYTFYSGKFEQNTWEIKEDIGIVTQIPLTYKGTQWEILRKIAKNNNKEWIKLSEAILSILGECWEKFICSSLPTRLMEEFPTRCTYNLHPDSLGSFPADLCPDITGQFGCGQKVNTLELN